jgi:hypothetical protein
MNSSQSVAAPKTSADAIPTADGRVQSLRKRQWAPRMWEGCNFCAWLRLLRRNRFAVQLPYLYIAVIVTFVSTIHSVLRWLQELWYGDQIAQTEIREAPIFIVGHWRTGTTLLHEYMILDERHNFPTTYECMEPNHFLLTEGFMTRWMRFLAPTHRPMDNMQAGFDRPQEDEFALCMLGQPSPYLRIAFPNRPEPYPGSLTLAGLSPRVLRSWKYAFLRFLQQVTFKDPRRLVLKSPPHSCRIKVLLEMFPDARFLHIVRDPYVVFSSTMNLWKSMYRTHGLQTPTFEGLEEQVLSTFQTLYQKLEEGSRLVPPGHFYELRYEDLVRNPIEEMRKVYEHLGLGGFDRFQPRLEAYLANNKDYQTNRYDLAPQTRGKISERWGDVIRKYGYGHAVPAGTGVDGQQRVATP